MTEISIGIEDLRAQVRALGRAQFSKGPMSEKDRGMLDGLWELCHSFIDKAEQGEEEITVKLEGDNKIAKVTHIAILVKGGCVQEVVSDHALTYTVVDGDVDETEELPLAETVATTQREKDIERTRNTGEWLDIPVGSGG
jgi:ABC-type methionine transport system ATPase subunit